ncbi:MAG: hypothetical protein NW220_17005 [Leptolyngbyaceae cyanobacterium bins.349]|nr:hypothetical protein [Leptolyngbyaceae cyanobacterium bins.349]
MSLNLLKSKKCDRCNGNDHTRKFILLGTMVHNFSINRHDAIAHLIAVGFQAGEKVWFRLWLDKKLPPDLAADLGLAYKDQKGQYQLSTVNGFLIFGSSGDISFTQLFGQNKQLYRDGWKKLEEFNRKGYGVGFIPNRGGTKDKDISECQCLFYESDNKSLDVQEKEIRAFEELLGKPASFILKTRKSLHCWFKLTTAIEPQKWKLFQKRLAQYHQSDSSLHDPSQVMRLAGFLHQSVTPDVLKEWTELEEIQCEELRKLARTEFLKDHIWSSVPVTIIQNNSTCFQLDEFHRTLPELRSKKEDQDAKSKSEESIRVNKPSRYVPLQLCLSPCSQLAVEKGEVEGKRNQTGFALACDLLGVETYLKNKKQEFDGNPIDLFHQYCDRCHPPLPDAERRQIWQSAESETRNPTLPPEQIEHCISTFLKEDGHALEKEFAKISKNKVSLQDTEKIERTPITQQLLEMAREATFFHTPDMTAYADVFKDGVRQTLRVKDTPFKQWLRYSFYQTTQKAITKDTLTQVVDQLDAEACFEGEEKQVYLRTAKLGDTIYLDLGRADWQVVEINAEGWRVITSAMCPVRFRRPDHLFALPLPELGGSIEELKEVVNLDETAWILVGPWILFCFYPDYPHPILILFGEAGTGKSLTAQTIKLLTDPGKAPLLGQVSQLRDLSIQANNRWVLVYDNLSYLSAEKSDALCRISTGGGFSTRTLCTDSGETVFEYIRPQIITGIDSLAERGDLLERALLVKLHRISEEKRLTEHELHAKLEQLKPRVLGALLTALSQTLKVLPTVNPKKLPRLADFARFAIAAEPALGLAPGSFMQVFEQIRQESHEIVVEACPIATAIQKLMDSQDYWKGTATELLGVLNTLVDELVRKSKGWVTNAQTLGKKIQRLAPDLRGVGIEIQFIRKKTGRFLEIQRNSIQSSLSSLPSQSGDIGAVRDDEIIFDAVTPQSNTVTSDNPTTSDLPIKSDDSDDSDNKKNCVSSVWHSPLQVGDRVVYSSERYPTYQNQVLTVYQIAGSQATLTLSDGRYTTWLDLKDLKLAGGS